MFLWYHAVIHKMNLGGFFFLHVPFDGCFYDLFYTVQRNVTLQSTDYECLKTAETNHEIKKHVNIQVFTIVYHH